MLLPGASFFLGAGFPDASRFREAGVAMGAQAALTTQQPVHTLLSWLLSRSQDPQFGDDVLVFWLQRMGLGGDGQA